MLFDSCTDDSFNLAFKEASRHSLKIKALDFYEELYETRANNEALKWFMLESKNEIIALFQDDIVLKDPKFAEKCRLVTGAFEGVGLVGGRTGFELKSTKFPERAVDKVSNWEHRPEQYGMNLKQNNLLYQERTFLNRGPLVFTRKLIEKVGYFDPEYYPMWGDDLDYCARCKFQYGLKNLVFQCDVECREEWGTMRAKPNPIIKRAMRPNWERFISKWGKYIENPIISK